MLAGDHKLFDGELWHIGDGLLVYDDEHMKKWKDYFTTINFKTSSEILSLVDDTANRRIAPKQQRNYYCPFTRTKGIKNVGNHSKQFCAVTAV